MAKLISVVVSVYNEELVLREFYQEMNGQPMNEDEERILAGVIETAEEMV